MNRKAVWSTACFSLGLMGGGCRLLHPKPQPPAIIVPQPPILFPAALYADAPMPWPNVLAPAIVYALPPFPLDPVGAAPPLRRLAETPHREDRPEEIASPPPAPAPPQLTTSLSPNQEATARRQTTLLLAQTQRELRLLYNRRLDNSAAATRAQASEYVRQASLALDQGDLVRAQTLAQKAEMLARFLLGQ